MIVMLCLIILSLVSIILFLAKIIIKQKKLILSYDNNLKKQGNMGRLMFLANFAKTCGHDVEIRYSTIHDYTYVLFYENGWGSTNIATLFTVIVDDESFEEAVKELERSVGLKRKQ